MSERVQADKLFQQAQTVLSMVDSDGGHGENVDDLIAAAQAGDELASMVVRFLEQSTTQLPFAPHLMALHDHEWVKVNEEHQGLTQIRTYECRGCLAHTTLTGPMGIRSPFEVEESTDD